MPLQCCVGERASAADLFPLLRAFSEINKTRVENNFISNFIFPVDVKSLFMISVSQW